MGGDFCWSVFGNHAVFGGETKRCFLDGDEMVHIQNFRFRNVFFWGDLINAFVPGLEGGSSKDVFQTSFFSTSNLWFCSICFKPRNLFWT